MSEHAPGSHSAGVDPNVEQLLANNRLATLQLDDRLHAKHAADLQEGWVGEQAGEKATSHEQLEQERQALEDFDAYLNARANVDTQANPDAHYDATSAKETLAQQWKSKTEDQLVVAYGKALKNEDLTLKQDVVAEIQRRGDRRKKPENKIAYLKQLDERLNSVSTMHDKRKARIAEAEAAAEAARNAETGADSTPETTSEGAQHSSGAEQSDSEVVPVSNGTETPIENDEPDAGNGAELEPQPVKPSDDGAEQAPQQPEAVGEPVPEDSPTARGYATEADYPETEESDESTEQSERTLSLLEDDEAEVADDESEHEQTTSEPVPEDSASARGHQIADTQGNLDPNSDDHPGKEASRYRKFMNDEDGELSVADQAKIMALNAISPLVLKKGRRLITRPAKARVRQEADKRANRERALKQARSQEQSNTNKQEGDRGQTFLRTNKAMQKRLGEMKPLKPIQDEAPVKPVSRDERRRDNSVKGPRTRQSFNGRVGNSVKALNRLDQAAVAPLVRANDERLRRNAQAKRERIMNDVNEGTPYDEAVESEEAQTKKVRATNAAKKAGKSVMSRLAQASAAAARPSVEPAIRLNQDQVNQSAEATPQAQEAIHHDDSEQHAGTEATPQPTVVQSRGGSSLASRLAAARRQADERARNEAADRANEQDLSAARN
jgi:hypothetical protein